MAVRINELLPPAPPQPLGPDGAPRFGAYAGSFHTVSLDRLAGTGAVGLARRLARRKRWFYTCIATEEILLGCGIVELGYAANGFYFLADLVRGGLLAEGSVLGVPGVTVRVNDHPGEGASASAVAPGTVLRLSRPEGTPAYQLRIRSGNFTADALLDAALAPPPLALVTSVVGGLVSATQKTNLLPSAGSVRIGERRWSLGGGFGGMDYTNGLLARQTRWRWGFGLGRATDGTPVGFNLAEGNYEGAETENVVWVGNELRPAGRPRFRFDADRPDAPWEIGNSDGSVDLRLTPKALHREERNLVVVKSRFAQASGVYAGTIRDGSGRAHTVAALPGVAENQFVIW